MSKIEWTDKTWNPTRGCSRCSPGCDNCYAMGQAHRFDWVKSVPDEPELVKGPYHELTVYRTRGPHLGVDWSGKVRFVADELETPLHWRKPRRIFVNSMSDLFHPSFENEQIAAVFGVMAACPQHTFQVLTKRAARMRSWFEWMAQESEEPEGPAAPLICGIHSMNHGADVDYLGLPDTWPLPNVWLGVSVEDRSNADVRIPDLLRTPAAVRFVSCEPLLGPLTLGRWLAPVDGECEAHHGHNCGICRPRCGGAGLHWVIVGGESGPKARPFNVHWATRLREQCEATQVAFFMKQFGRRPYIGSSADSSAVLEAWLRLKHKKGADMSEWPPEMRIRQYPERKP